MSAYNLSPVGAYYPVQKVAFLKSSREKTLYMGGDNIKSPEDNMEKISRKVYLFIGRNADELKDISKRYCIQFGYFNFTDISDNHKIIRDFLIESRLDVDYDNIAVVDVLSNAVRLAAIIN